MTAYVYTDGMTALQIIRALKADKRAVLWLNRDRREAAFMPGVGGCCTLVDINDALVAKTDTNLRMVEGADGEFYLAM